jgi:DNA-binding NtrC family response regulator
LIPITTLRSERPDLAAVRGSTFRVDVLEGPDTGRSFVIEPGRARALVGQSPVCELQLRDPEVSRRHAALAVEGSRLLIFDLTSTNGTTVNGLSVEKAHLVGGESIRVGRSVLMVRRGTEHVVSLSATAGFGRVRGESVAMRRLYPLLEALASNEQPVLLEGENGVGKELIAEELASAKVTAGDRPFVVLETGELSNAQILERLFGAAGLVEQAAGGTLFIDEIGDLPREAQRKLRGLTAARLIVATRRDLDRDISEGRFSNELFHELAPGRVEVPPLREREGDVPVLARHLWAETGEAGELPADFLPRFEHYLWPGNVRELRSAVVARRTLGELAPSYRSDDPTDGGRDIIARVLDRSFSEARELVMREFERRYVERIMAAHGGNVTHAARASGVALRYFKLVRSRLGMVQ